MGVFSAIGRQFAELGSTLRMKPIQAFIWFCCWVVSLKSDFEVQENTSHVVHDHLKEYSRKRPGRLPRLRCSEESTDAGYLLEFLALLSLRGTCPLLKIDNLCLKVEIKWLISVVLDLWLNGLLFPSLHP